MKKSVFFILAFIAVTFTSCLDIIDTLTLKDDGSGLYSIKMDVSGLLAMGGEKPSDKEHEKRDTTIYFTNKVDTSTAYTAEEKKVMRNMYSKMHMDTEQKEMWFEFYYPFKNTDEFKTIQLAMDKESRGDAIASALAAEAPAGATMGMMDKKGSDMMDKNEFLFDITKNTLEKKVKQTEKSAETEVTSTDEIKTEQTEEEKMMEMMFGSFEMNFTTIINLPKAITVTQGKNYELSADKKTVTFKNKFTKDGDTKNEDFAFKLAY